MTPKEKAKELYITYYMNLWFSFETDRTLNSKQCALIAVDEIFKTGLLEGSTLGINKKYWQEVKQEIELL